MNWNKKYNRVYIRLSLSWTITTKIKLLSEKDNAYSVQVRPEDYNNVVEFLKNRSRRSNLYKNELTREYCCFISEEDFAELLLTF